MPAINKKIQFEHDRLLDISNVENYTNTNVDFEKIYFSEFVQKLKEPLIKQKGSAGGFVGGWVEDKRTNSNVKTRSMITLDIDDAESAKKAHDRVENYTKFAYVMYSTHNSTLDKPRYRLIIPLKDPIEIGVGDYRRAAEFVVSLLELKVDPASYTLSQLMNYPTCEKREQYEFYYRDSPLFSADDVPEEFGKEEKQTPSLQMVVGASFKPSPTMTDGEILQKASKAKNSERIKALYAGDHSNYDSQSEADLAFCNIFAFYTQDEAQLDRIYTNSGLYRDKWDTKRGESTYGADTIQKAINGLGATYQKNDFRITVKEGMKDSSSIDLQKELRKRRAKELEILVAAHKEEARNGKEPSKISPVRCAVILREYLSFVLFDLEENTRLAMYQPKEGIYTTNMTVIKRVISWIEPTLNNSNADDVIYHLTNRAEVREKTRSRYLIPVNNGVFNLKEKSLEAFNPKYIFTTKISTDYRDNPPLPVIDGWNVEDWLLSIACGDLEIVHLLWQVINDAMNGNYSRKKAIFLVGEGNNGKGTFQELIINLIGVENISPLKINQFDGDFTMSTLEGKTAVIGDDVPSNVHIDDSSNFNSVVTGDRVLVNPKGKSMYTATFNCCVIQSTNGMPSFKNKTEGTLRRLVIVPFNASFSGEIENFAIKDDYIRNEKVLQYVLHKAINMDFERFSIPKASTTEIQVFKQDNDPTLDFKLSVFDSWNIDEVPKPIVYEFYKRFCGSNGYKPLSNRKFHHQFKEHLGENWADGQRRFRYDDLLPHLGDLDLMGIGFPNSSVPQSSYRKM